MSSDSAISAPGLVTPTTSSSSLNLAIPPSPVSASLTTPTQASSSGNANNASSSSAFELPSKSSKNRHPGQTTGPHDGTDGARTYAVTSVAWAPSCGRSYHLIATGSRDGRVRVWKVRPGEESDRGAFGMDVDGFGGEDEGDEAKWSAILVAEFDQHKLVSQDRALMFCMLTPLSCA